jgi:hypothetical protein
VLEEEKSGEPTWEDEHDGKDLRFVRCEPAQTPVGEYE